MSSHHLETMLRIAFGVGEDNQCPQCGTEMVSVGQASPECPPSSITITMECPRCKDRHASLHTYQAIMTNQMKVVLECY